MGEIENLNSEIQQLVQQLEEKRKEAIKQKLQFLSQNKDDEKAHLTEEEWEILKDYLSKHGDCKSVKMQHSWYDDIDGFDTNDYEAVLRVGNKYIAIHSGMTQGHEYYSFDVSDSIDVQMDGEYVTINGIDFAPDRNDGWNGTKSIVSGKQELTKGLDIEQLFEKEMEVEIPQQAEDIDIDLRNFAYDLVNHRVIDTREEDVDIDYISIADLGDVVYNILRNTIIDTKSNAKFNETGNYCEIGQYSDMPGEEEIAAVLNSVDRKILDAYFKENPKDVARFMKMKSKYDDIQELDGEYEYDETLDIDDEYEYGEDEDDYEYEDDYGMNTEPEDEEVIYNILRNRIPDYNANAMFGESHNFCEIGRYEDMPGEEEIANILNSMSRETLKEYFEQNPEDLALFEQMRGKYADIQGLDGEIQQPKSARQQFEDSLLRDDVVEYYLSKTPEELEAEFGSEVSRMVGFEQKNAHHMYDLWKHTLHTVESLDTSNLTPEQAKKLKVAAFFHDIGKPDVVGFNPRTKQQNFINHAVFSVDIAKPMLEKLGYTPEEIQQISFYIAHHDDFLNYKETLSDKDKTHIFFRETNPSTVEEIIVQNQIDWDKLGIQCYLPTHTGNPGIDKRNGDMNSANNVKKRYICSALVNGVAPKFRDFKNQPVKVDVDIEDIKAKLATGKYNADYIPTEEDYKMLLELCKADARAQSEKVITIDPKTQKEVISDTRDRKVSTMQSIGQVIEIAYREGTDKISEATKKEIEELTGYSFEQFIKDSIPQALGEKRPAAVCKDGTEYSIQASSFNYCTPRQDGLDAYDEYEVGQVTDWETGNLRDYAEADGGVAGFVPVEVIKQILEAHGGLDKVKMLERIKEQKAVFQPKSDAYEKMIREASGGNEFLEKMLRYATRKVEVRDTEAKAKQLSKEYEEQLPKEQHSLDDND